ncbi:SDR family oxidoreductase [Aquamicrobium sp. LC103]|uniref:SDR family NAD(P)-dependent oxidoreductase n=1 Tax=Aquamicrobium sp. LC103 TaxID=1120658 RepID=UPI0009E3D021|nr:SDR family oxidoreductase [Aquamicrobium sp. LC103]TKT69793.1 SDR family oxidoreductase [Aquamicrobium sp. LC103]
MSIEFDEESVPDYGALLRLDGRIVAVIGAGRGIGRQTCHALAQAGANVACIDIDIHVAQKVADEVGGCALSADVRQEAEVEAVFDAVIEHLGRLDAVVDIVGASHGRPLPEIDAPFLERTFELNLFQAIHVTRVAADRMARTGGGAIVLVGSSAGFASLPNQIAYGSAKAALHHFVRGAASELGHRGIRVNAIAPGYVRTERMLARFAPEQWYEVETNTPMQRAGATPDIAGVALFLVQDLSSYLSGQVILADGGMLNPPRVMRTSSARQIAGMLCND